MRIEIDAGDCDRPRCGRAAEELRRLKAQAEHAYYVRVAEGRMDRILANERLEAMATALLLCQATDDALALAERMGADRTLFDAVAGRAEKAEGAERPAGTAGPTLALSLPELPYDKGSSVAAEAPRCRFCGMPGERAGKDADSWRCSQEECVGRSAWMRAAIFAGGAA